jgi:hypothetical protein
VRCCVEQLDETELLIQSLRKEVQYLRKENEFLSQQLGKQSAGPVLPAVLCTAQADCAASSMLPRLTPSLPSSSESVTTVDTVSSSVSADAMVSGSPVSMATAITDMTSSNAMMQTYQAEIDRLRAELADVRKQYSNEAEQAKTIMEENE